jgi:hypothetical protein
MKYIPIRNVYINYKRINTIPNRSRGLRIHITKKEDEETLNNK